MNGPDLIELERLLAEAPASVLDPAVSTAAVVNDALLDLGCAPLSAAEYGAFPKAGAGKATSRDALLRLASRLLGHPFFAAWAETKGAGARGLVVAALSGVVLERAAEAGPERFMNDVEGREEVARALLAGIGERPAGETAAQAENRFKAVDSVERKRVMARAKEAEARAREIREAIEKQEAEEAASKMSRE